MKIYCVIKIPLLFPWFLKKKNEFPDSQWLFPGWQNAFQFSLISWSCRYLEIDLILTFSTDLPESELFRSNILITPCHPPESELFRSNILRIFSLLPVSKFFPSLENATVFTMCLWANVLSSSPLTASHTFLQKGINKCNFTDPVLSIEFFRNWL